MTPLLCFLQQSLFLIPKISPNTSIDSMISPAKHISVRHYPIRLGQFLKFIDIAQDGQEAKKLILHGSVKVNGDIEKRRGRQLRAGDIVEVYKDYVYILK